MKSRLYGLHPQKVGTPFVESLLSYLIRLAESHAVYLGDLLAYEIAPMLEKEYLLNSIDRGGNRFYDGARTINGTEKNANDMVATLEKLTGVEKLEELTLVEFKGVFPVRKLLRKSLAWCPKCLGELRMTDSSYYPLIWSFTAYNVCTNHKIDLEQKCPTCNKSIPFLHRKSRIGVCPYCQSQLLQLLSNPHCIDPKSYYISQSIESFFDEVSIEQKLNLNTLYENLSSILYNNFEGNIQSLANYIGVPKTTVWGWINKEVTPPLNSILDMAYTLNISAKALYIEQNKIEIKSNVITKDISKVAEARDRCTVSNEEVAVYLYEIQKQHLCVKTISDIAKDLKCSTKFLYTNFPECCKKISERNHQIRTQEKSLQISSLKEQIKEICHACFLQNIFPTRKLIERELNLPCLFKNRQMKEYFYQVRLEFEKQFSVYKEALYATRTRVY